METGTAGDAQAQPFAAPWRAVPWHAPLGWLAAGWRDLARAPGVGLCFGALVMAVSVAVTAMGWWLGKFALLAALLSGFVFVAPLLGAALYEVSRSLERGGTPRAAACVARARRIVGQAGVFTIAQVVVLLLWSRAGMLVNAFVTIEDGTLHSLLQFIAVGSAIGAVFAAFNFAASAFSLPMVADRDVDMVTALVSSVNAVLHNRAASVTWAVLIAVLTGIGFATAFVGLVVIMPWLAFASWHGYRAVLDASRWPALD